MLVSVMVVGKDSSVLSAALNGIASASLAARDKLLLQKHAVQIFMAEMAPAPAVRGVCTEAIDDVAALYAVLSEAAGVRISRPTAAVAFVKVLGLDCFNKRISKLSSRRNHAAHPDPGFIDDISAAIHGLGPAALAALSASFRCRMKHDDAADEHLVHDSETGQHVLADTKVDGPLTLHQPSAQATDHNVHTRALLQDVPGLQQDPLQHDMQPKVQPDGQPTAIPAASMSAGKYLNLADLPPGICGTTPEDYKVMVRDILRKHNPQKLGDLPAVLAQYHGKKHELFGKVFTKYVVGNNSGSFSGRGLTEGHLSSSAAA